MNLIFGDREFVFHVSEVSLILPNLNDLSLNVLKRFSC